MAIDLRVKTEALVRSGGPISAPAQPGEFVLTMQEMLNLFDIPELFFNMNSLFAILKVPVEKALKTLLVEGIIGPIGQPLKRKGGCGGCARRKLYAFALQTAERVQFIVLQAAARPDLKERLAAELKAYLLKKYPGRYKAGDAVVLYAKLKDNTIKKVIL